MPKRDPNQQAACAVEKITGSKPVRGEDLVSSEELKRKFAAGVEEKPWGLERVVQITEEYLRRKEDAIFADAFAEALG